VTPFWQILGPFPMCHFVRMLRTPLIELKNKENITWHFGEPTASPLSHTPTLWVPRSKSVTYYLNGPKRWRQHLLKEFSRHISNETDYDLNVVCSNKCTLYLLLSLILSLDMMKIRSSKYFKTKKIFYSVFHRFREAKFGNGGSI
jgi:hypothetical protein